MVCCITGHPGSWGVQREVPEASEDMGRPAASLLVPSLPLHVCTCVLLVHASAAGQASRLVSRLPSISTSVSVRGLAPHPAPMQPQHKFDPFTLFSFRVWLLRKMLIMIFSLITEKNSKDVFRFVHSHFKTVWCENLKNLSGLFSSDEKLEDLKARKRKIVSDVISTGYCTYYLFILLVLII